MTSLNFGCGKNIIKGYENVDLKDFDFNIFPYPYKDNTFDYVLVDNVLEHLIEPEKVLNELRRICKNKAVIEIIVPHCFNIGSFNDVTHKHHFNDIALLQVCGQFSLYKDTTNDFKIVYLKKVPTLFGKLFIWKLRDIAGNIFNGIYDHIELKLEVRK